MKESPQTRKLEQILRSSKLVAGGFMGDDSRSFNEVIYADASQVSKLGYTMEEIAARMQEITDTAKTGLGNWIKVDDKLQAVADEAKGSLICPWPHSGRYVKRITTVQRYNSGETIRWSELNIHLIAEHGFFEGRGAAFRIEPVKLINVIF
ncbi:MAG: hypothetical protein H8D56_07875 [Planctomycetes bacterium]|nr:hypothetical protein [Planctomycetota bacterium]MBL7145555.1 hypothetical protein [Phycisphaerae bacterium]